MWKRKLCCEVTLLMFLSRVTYITCQFPCPSGTCPMVMKTEEHNNPYLVGKIPCGVCGSTKIGGPLICQKVFYSVRHIKGDNTNNCRLRFDPCREKSCVAANTDRCEDVYLTMFCCMCKQNWFGTDCDMPPVIDTFAGPIDVRDRPTCWVQFHGSALPWKSGPTLATVALVSWKEKINDHPFVVLIRDAAKYVWITKFTTKIKKAECLDWCLTHTNIGVICHHFNLIFDPKYEGVEVKSLILYESEFSFYHSEKPLGRAQSAYYRGDKTIGASFFVLTRVYPVIPKPPYLLLFDSMVMHSIGYAYGMMFSNQTAVDSTCVPWIIPLCALDRKKANTAFPYVTVSFKMEYRRPPPQCERSSIEQWKVFKENLNVFYKGGEEIMTREGCCTLTFPPYTFAPGNYLIKLTMMHIQNANKVYNSKFCYQQIYNDKIKAYFNEVVKIVNTEDSNKVEVEAKDINRPPNEQKKNLVYVWSCKFNGTENPCTGLNKAFKNSPSIQFSPYELKVNLSYNFTVNISSTAHVKGIPNDTSTAVYQLLIVTTVEHFFISLRCATCVGPQLLNPQEVNVILIRARDGKSPPAPADYEWQFAEETGGVVGEFRSVVDIREEHGASNTVLKIKSNVLEHDKIYVFQAKVPDSKTFAQIRLRTLALEPFMTNELNCTLEPKEGVRGWTDFNIECVIEEETLLFEFYDKDDKDESIFGGRMLGYNNFGTLSNFKMTKGKFVVLVFDEYSTIMNYTQIVPLVPFNNTLNYLEELLWTAEEFTESRQFDWPTATVSSVADVIERGMNPPAETIKQLVLILHRVYYSYSLGLVKMVLSSLKIVLTNTVSKFDILELDAHMSKTAADVLLVFTFKLMMHEGNTVQERSLPLTVFFEMIKAVFDCAEILLVQKNREFRYKTEEYVTPFVSDLVQKKSFALVSVLDTASYSLSRQQIPGDDVKRIVSDMKKLLASTKVDFPGGLSNWTVISENCSVVISSKSISSAGNSSHLLRLQYVRMRVNPFWWAGENIVSEVLLVNLCQRTELIDCRKLTRFKDFVTLRLSVIEPLSFIVPIEGTACQVDPKTTEEYKELELTMYRFFLPERAKLFIKFILEDTQEYRIMLTEGLRPEYASVVENPSVINASSPDYNVPYDNKHEIEKVYYMAILPSSKASVGERVPFRFKAYYSLCNTWVRWQWTSFGCWVGAETNEETIHCDCDHLSEVAGAIVTPDHDLSTVTEFLLYLTPWENILPLFILLLIILLFLLLSVWAVMKDRKDRRRGGVIVLDDNFPGEHYAYLLGVHTGSRLNSGTSASVGVRLIGEIDTSRPHILRSPDRSVLNAFSEDWFLIYSPLYLGKLRILWLWHDDEGSSPDWFVDSVEVYDLKTKVQYFFQIHTWLAMEENASPEVFVTPGKVTGYISTMNTFQLNLVNGLRDTHNWTSVCLKHPRNPVSRVHRVCVIVCFVLSAMAVCLLLYLFNFGFHIDEDKPSYHLATTDLLIFIITLIAASIVACLIMGLFRKSITQKDKVSAHPHDHKTGPSQEPGKHHQGHVHHSEKDKLQHENIDHLHTTHGDHYHNLETRDNPVRGRSTCDRYALALYKIAQGNSLLPVRLKGAKSDLIVRKHWLITAWILCIIIISLSVLIILFFAWKLPTIKDEKVLTVFLAVVVFDAIVTSFFKILLFSALLSCIFQNTMPHTKYHIKIKDGRRLHLFGDAIFLAKLLQTRKQSRYYNLSESVLEKKRQIKIRKIKWRKVIEFVIAIFLLCIISAICKMYYVNRYRSNTHAAHMMTTGESTRIPNLQQVRNRTELYTFLENTYLSRVYRFMWYDHAPLMLRDSIRKDWTSDCVTRLLGNARIRQLRVNLDDCRVSGYFGDSIRFCAPPWSTDAENKDVYAASWLLAEYKDTIGKISAWRYEEPESSNSSSFYGPSGTLYHGGGYIARLGSSKRETRASLVYLEVMGWLDHMTRVVFVELTLYNVNTELFTQVVLVCEQHPSGQYIARPKVETATINIGFDFWNIGFIVFQVFFLFRQLYLMNRQGVIEYFSSGTNKYKVVLLTLGFAMIGFYVVHVKYSAYYEEEFHRKGHDQFFSFSEIIKFEFISKAMMCFLFVCVVVNLLLNWRFGTKYFSFYYTFLLSWSLIAWLTLFLTISVIVFWRFIGYCLNVFIFPYFSIAIVYPKVFKTKGVQERWEENLVIYLMCISSYFLIVLFIVLFTYFYREEKRSKPFTYTEISKFNYLTFLKVEIERLVGREKLPS